MKTVKIAGKFWLEKNAADAYARARADGMPAGITSAGRTLAEQRQIYNDWRAGKMPNTPTVARPGNSRHETGRALDIPEPARSWMHKHGAKYGWKNPAWAKDQRSFEPWHFEFTPPDAVPGGVHFGGLTKTQVKALQAFLGKNFPAYARAISPPRAPAVDGIAGPHTVAWLKEFQRRTGLSPDGIPGPKTRKKLAQYGLKL